MTKNVLTVLFILTLIPPLLDAQEKAPSLTLREKLSYSLGTKVGTNLTRELIQQHIETHQINLDIFLKGFNDGFLNTHPLLLEESELHGAILEFQKQKRNREIVSQQLKRLAALLSTYRSDIGEYPASLEELMTNSTNNQFWKGPYVEDDTLFKDPWGFSYQYRYPGHHKRYGLYNYDLFSYGPDGVEGGQEENMDIAFQASSGQSFSDHSNQKSETQVDESNGVASSEEEFRTLQISYKHNSWTRIVDSRNQELFSGVAKGGENVFVKGIPPFQLKFGRTEGISIEYNGEKFLLETHSHLKNGRITLGQEK